MCRNDVITIGLPIALSGRYALQGHQGHARLECHIAEVNGAGDTPSCVWRNSLRQCPYQIADELVLSYGLDRWKE